LNKLFVYIEETSNLAIGRDALEMSFVTHKNLQKVVTIHCFYTLPFLLLILN